MDLLPADKDPFLFEPRPHRSVWWYSRRAILFTFLMSVIYSGIMLNRSCQYDNRYDDLTLTKLQDIKPIKTDNKPVLGIAFGGGGVRGFMHLGALKALEEANIKADIAVGSSAGAVVAAIYASGQTIEEMLISADSMDGDSVYALTLNKRGIVSGREISEWVQHVTNNINIEELPMPAGFTVTDLSNNNVLLATAGNVGQAVQASVSIPGVFIPVKSKQRILVDGGLYALVPVKFTRAMGADIVIGIDIYCGAEPIIQDYFASTLVVATRLQNCEVSRAETESADFVMRPTFEPKSSGDFSAHHAMVEAGYREMKKLIPKLKQRLDRVKDNALN